MIASLSLSNNSAAANAQTPVVTPVAQRETALPQAQTVSEPERAEQLRQATQRLNDTLQSIHKNLQFSIDEDTGETVVKIVDTETHEVIRQIPTEEALAVSKSIGRLHGLLLHDQA